MQLDSPVGTWKLQLPVFAATKTFYRTDTKRNPCGAAAQRLHSRT